MTAKKKKPARKPGKLLFRERGGYALCEQEYHGQRFFYTNLFCQTGRMYGKDATRFAAWMAKAAAWCSEKPRKKARKR